MDYYENDLEILSKAMLEARKRFREYLLEEHDIDPAFFELRLKGVKLSDDFEPYQTIRMMDYTNKKGNKPPEGVE